MVFFLFLGELRFIFLSGEHLFLDLTNFWAGAIAQWKNTCVYVNKRFLWDTLDGVRQLCVEGTK